MHECVEVSKHVAPARRGLSVRAVFIVLALAAVMCVGYGSAYAFNIPTGDQNLQLRFDNTVRYFLQYRIASQDQAILASPNGDDGDRNFDKGIVSNRLDLLSELDFINKAKGYGVPVQWRILVRSEIS